MNESCEVLVVGGGPVGLTLAAELGRRGVVTVVIDLKAGFHEHPRASYIGPGTLEIFSSWGIIQQVFEAAVDRDFPVDIAFTATLAGEEFLRLSYPSRAEMEARTPDILRRFPQLACSRYSQIVIGQDALEPVLGRYVRSLPTVRHYHQHELLSFIEDPEGVTAVIQTADGTERKIRAAYLAGCDGGRSVVRRGAGLKMEGVGALGESVNTFFRCENLSAAIGKRPAAVAWSLQKGATGAILAMDGRDHWVFSRHLLPDENHTDQDPAIKIRQALGKDVPFDVISSWHWIPRELVATSYRRNRTLLVGDAAHLMSPTGGYGLNTGIGDAANLGWKLAAMIQGWGGEHILASYELERKPIAERNSRTATDNRAAMRRLMLAGRDLLLDQAAIDQARATIVASERQHGKHFNGLGIYLGDRYDLSPLIVADDTPTPIWDPEIYRPSAKPGGRLPSIWIDERTTLQDICGPGFTILSDDVEEIAQLSDTLNRRGIPTTIAPIPATLEDQLSGRHFIVRPDGIIAWRGYGAPAVPDDIAQIVSGHGKTLPSITPSTQ